MKVGDLFKIPLTIGVFCLVSSSVFGAMDRDSRVSELENQMSQVATNTSMDTFGANTASARPNVVNGVNWFITLDALFWRTRVGGTEYAYSDQGPTATLPIKGAVKDMDFDWDWGVRVGLGYNFAYDDWDVKAAYTWWETGGSDSTRAGLNSSIIPTRGSSHVGDDPTAPANTAQGLFLFCTSAKSQYSVDFQAIDLELGRDYYVSSNISLRPFWGLKTAWIDLDQITRYTGGQVVSSQGGDFLGLERNTVRVRESSDFWGIGPRTGLNSRWYLGEGISIYANVAAAALFGFFDVDHKEKYTAFDANRIRLHANRHTLSPTVQGQVGLQYATYLFESRYHISIGAAFEAQYWWRQNQMLKIDDSATLKYERYSEDLALYGFTLSGRWDF